MASTIPYSLECEDRDDYLYVCISAESINRNTALAYLSEVAERLKASSKKRLMLLRDIPEMLPDGDLFSTTLEFLEMIRGTRVAFVNPHLSIDESMSFAMTIGKNRGAKYELFNDPLSAERWLLM